MPATTAAFPTSTARAGLSTASTPAADGSSILGQLFNRNTKKTCTCYRCGRAFELPAKAQTASCPHCHKHLQVDDIVVRSLHWGGDLCTCGSITIAKKARASCKQITAAGDVIVLGALDGKIKAGGQVRIGQGATFRGQIEAPFLHVENGATLEGGPFRITSAS